MSNYRAGDIIRLTRIAEGITQEELCDGICGVQTLHRIENGKVRVKNETYYCLMQKMNRMPEKNYAVCVGKNMELLEERAFLEEAVSKQDYKCADQYLNSIIEKADDNVFTVQYIKKMKALIDFHNKRIGKEQLVHELEQALSLTLTDYEQYLDKVFPFTEQEILALVSIANAYNRINEDEKCIQINCMLLRCLNHDYMRENDRVHIRITIMCNLARLYGIGGEHKKALALLNKGIKLSQEYGYGNKYAPLYGGIAYNILRQIENGERNKEDKEIARQCLMQAYYLSAAKGYEKHAQDTLRAYENEFKESLL